jgi:hypothetical protein
MAGAILFILLGKFGLAYVNDGVLIEIWVFVMLDNRLGVIINAETE